MIKNTDGLREYSLHLKSLTTEDRFTRFGYAAQDHHIDQLILNMLYHPEKHHLFVVIVNNKPAGYSHLAEYSGSDWELAVSVDSSLQNAGLGNKLMSHALTWAKTHGVTGIFMHCINDNKKIQHLAAKHGLKVVERDGSEITSKMELPQATPMEFASELLKENADLAAGFVELHSRWVQNITQLRKN